MAIVTLRGRFQPGARVKLWQVKDESVLRAEGGELIDEKVVDEDGCVQFSKGVKVGGRYLIVGQREGEPLEVRVRGNAPDDDNSLLTHAPVRPERQKLADGRWADEVLPVGMPRRTVEDNDNGDGRPTHVSEAAPDAPVESAAALEEESSAAKSAAKNKSTTAKSRGSRARKEQ